MMLSSTEKLLAETAIKAVQEAERNDRKNCGSSMERASTGNVKEGSASLVAQVLSLSIKCTFL